MEVLNVQELGRIKYVQSLTARQKVRGAVLFINMKRTFFCPLLHDKLRPEIRQLALIGRFACGLRVLHQ
jgi:hypothetical protein